MEIKNQQLPKLRDGSEWSPSLGIQPKKQVLQPIRPVVQIVEDILIDWFLREQPRADEVHVVKNSLRLVDTTHNVWVARVQTFVYFDNIEPRIHESSVKFKVEVRKHRMDVTKDFYTIHHNHIIFTS